MSEEQGEPSVAEKRARLARMLQQKANQPVEAPLSFSQQRLWFVDQLEPGSPLYNITVTVRVRGDLRENVLRDVMDEIVARHEPLRTTFGMRGLEPIQLIAPRGSSALEFYDLNDLEGSDFQDKIERLVRDQARTRFDLARGPLYRAAMVRVTPREYIASFTTHHIISDGWSIGVMLFELASGYSRALGKRTTALPKLSIQYRDFARWQMERLQGEELDRLMSFWREELKGAPNTLDLPTDRPRPSKVTYTGTVHRFRFPSTLQESLKELSRREQSTFFMTVLAGYAALLCRYSGQHDMLIGIPVTGRERPETQPLVGYFVNIVVARARLLGNPTFRELLTRIRKSMLDAYAHQEIPFEKLVEALQPKRVLDRNPLVQVVYLHQNFPLPSNEDSRELQLEPLEIHPGFSRFELGLRTEQMPDGLECLFEYNTDLFDVATIERLADHFRTLLERVAADPTLRIDEVPLISEREVRQLTKLWNEASSTAPPAVNLPTVWQTQVERTPDEIAIHDCHATFTYRDLDCWANRLAADLTRCDLEREECVGLLASPSAALAAGVLGILKAGGAYVPLSLQDPIARMIRILRDANARVVLIDRNQTAVRAELLRQGFSSDNVLTIEDDQRADPARISDEVTKPLSSDATVDELACVIFATGSPSGPLGTALEHGQLGNYVAAAREQFGLKPGARHALVSPLASRATITSVLLPLLTGGTVVIAPHDAFDNAPKLATFLHESNIDVLHLTPAQLAIVLQESAPPLPRGCLVLSGEQVPWELALRLRQAAPDLPIWWEFCPVEAAGGGLVCEIPRGDLTRLRSRRVALPSGGSTPHGQVWILDPHRRLTPIGIPGDLYLAGAGVARGYLGAPDVSRGRFVEVDLPGGGQTRLFRTGQRARWLSDGSLQQLGRPDEQVSIAGYSVLPQEIQATLAQHAQVAECAVIRCDDLVSQEKTTDGDTLPCWVAYVVSQPGSVLNVDDLRAYLETMFPNAMVPAAFFLLDTLPRQLDGQLDRDALPVPRRMRARRTRQHVPPQTPTQRAVAAIWERLLGIERIGIHDDFFELGGNSLMAMQLVNALRDQWHIELPLRGLFGEPTVANTARLIDDALRLGGAAESQPLGPVPDGARLPLSPSQQMLWLMEQFDRRTAFNALLGVRLHGALDRTALERALAEVMRRHEILRAAIVVSEGQPEHVPRPCAAVPLECHDLRDLPRQQRKPEATRLAEQNTLERFELSAGYLVRFLLVQLDDDQHLLYCVLHHMVSDGWSFPILWREVAEIYQAYSRNLPSPLPDPAVQFTDFAYWQSQRDDAESLEQSAYWRDQLRGPLPVLDLPTDHSRSATMHTQPDVCEFEIPASLTQALAALGKQEGATVFMTLLAAYVTLLHRYTRQDELMVGTPMANRLRPETRDLIGFFATMLPLRSDVSGDPSFLELLGRVRNLCIDAFSRSEPNWESLASAFQLPEPGRMPVCQAFFTLGEFPEEPFTAGDVHWQPFDVNVVRVSGFDLVLALRERGASLGGALLYRPDLFRAETVARLRDSFLELLAGIAASPTTPVSQLPLLAPAERRLVLDEWNQTSAPFPADQCVHQLFEERARRTPAALAIIESGNRTTYRELDQMADMLAEQLREAGVQAESLVAILVPRSAEMVAALLGVWKAGGAYLPLDPSWPRRRMATVLRDARIAAVVTQSRGEPQLAAILAEHETKIPLLTVDRWRQQAEQVEGPAEVSLVAKTTPKPNLSPKPSQLAYVIYTSGSTGPPKGVMIEHRSVVNVVTSFCHTYSLGVEDRVLQQASVAFDVSVNEIFPILLAGGTLVIPRQEDVADFDGLAHWIPEHRISIMGATPSALAELNRRAEQLKSLRLVLSGGEALAKLDIDKLVEFANVTNGYGPTETTVCATFFDLRQMNWANAATIPIGKPLPNYQVYVLDRQLQPVPIGCPGELCIGGAGLARGYLGDPELSKQKFVPHPFAKGQRLYRTGDEARWLADGNLEFLGRLDRQVKIRGFRIELGEVEAVLRELPDVQQAVAICDSDHRGNSRLVAYMVLEPTVAATESKSGDVRKQAAEKLPAHMVPAVILFLPELPLTENGKVDVRNLPRPQLTRPELDVPYVAPRDSTEQKLAVIWREALGIERVGVLDNFFHLGGHSLLAAQIMHQVQRDLEVAFPYRLFFESPTIDQMARRIAAIAEHGGAIEAATATTIDPLVPLHPVRDTVPVYCLHSLGGQVHEYTRFARTLGETYPVYGIQSRALLDYQREQPSWQALAEDYAQLIRSHHAGPYQLVGHSAGGVLALAVAAALEEAGAEVRLVALLDSYWQLDEVAVARGAEQDLLAALRGTVQQLAPHLLETIEPLLDNSQLIAEELLSLPHAKRLKQIDAWIEETPLLPPGMGDHLRNQLRLYDCHRVLLDAYTLPRIRAPLHVVWATEVLPGTDPLPQFDWSQCTSGDVQTRTVQATHWSLLAPPVVDQIAATVAQRFQLDT